MSTLSTRPPRSAIHTRSSPGAAAMSIGSSSVSTSWVPTSAANMSPSGGTAGCAGSDPDGARAPPRSLGRRSVGAGARLAVAEVVWILGAGARLAVAEVVWILGAGARLAVAEVVWILVVWLPDVRLSMALSLSAVGAGMGQRCRDGRHGGPRHRQLVVCGARAASRDPSHDRYGHQQAADRVGCSRSPHGLLWSCCPLTCADSVWEWLRVSVHGLSWSCCPPTPLSRSLGSRRQRLGRGAAACDGCPKPDATRRSAAWGDTQLPPGKTDEFRGRADRPRFTCEIRGR